MPVSDIDHTVTLVKKDLALAEDFLPGSVASADELKKKMIPVINHLLNHDMERLLLALYRIDIDERKVKKVLTFEQPEQIAPKLSDLIIRRELQKVNTRKKYTS